MGSFDDEGKKIARATASLLKAAGTEFAVLGTEEKCCGDSARRLGNEYLFQTLALENLETFRKYGVRKIVTICPHGYNAFKNEYPALVDRMPGVTDAEKAALRSIEVVSHVELIARLVEAGALELRPQGIRRGSAAFTFHDPCYLGRHNGVIDPPRELLSRAMGVRPKELANRASTASAAAPAAGSCGPRNRSAHGSIT